MPEILDGQRDEFEYVNSNSILLIVELIFHSLPFISIVCESIINVTYELCLISKMSSTQHAWNMFWYIPNISVPFCNNCEYVNIFLSFVNLLQN